MADENKPFKQAKVYAGDDASSGEFTVTGSTSREGGQTVDEALRDAESRESFLKKSAEDRAAEAERLDEKYHRAQDGDVYHRLSALAEAVRLFPEIVKHLPSDMVKDVEDFRQTSGEWRGEEYVPHPHDYGGSVYEEMTNIPGTAEGYSPLEEQQRLLKQMKQDAGYNSLNSEMINKKNSGDK